MFELALTDLGSFGSGLVRPECVLMQANGDCFTSDARGGVAHTRPDGSQVLIGGPHVAAEGLKPNGIAMRPDGSFLFANLSESGGVWQLTRDGQVRPFLLEVDGITLPSTNFVWLDDRHRVWVCVSSTHKPSDEFSATRAAGFVALVDEHGARIVGDGIVWTNECRIDPTGAFLYINETWRGHLSRFRLAADGSLSAKETVCDLGRGSYPDGLTFDVQGGAWITCVVSNRLYRVDRDGRAEKLLEDYDPAHLDAVITALDTGTLTRPLVHKDQGRTLRNITSLAFGGPDLRTAYIGSALGSSLATFRSPVAGVTPAHWNF